jgi:TetR/AcrR family transcriptional regulator, mexJK operon transcriptional repressor
MESPERSRHRPGRGRSATKHRAILDAARETFLREGYGGTTMDEVAAAAGVAKQTVYAHFTDKPRLFEELIRSDIAHSAGAAHPLVARMADSADAGGDLRRFARVHAADVMQPHLLRLRRMLMAEAERFPALAAAWYDAGPAESIAVFERWFTVWHRRGLLHAPDPHLAAEHFNWLVLSIPLNKAMSLPLDGTDDPPFTPDQLDHYADEGVRVFLAAYGTRPAVTRNVGP